MRDDGQIMAQDGTGSWNQGQLTQWSPPRRVLLMVVGVVGFPDMSKHFIFTHPDSGALFLGEKKITIDVAPPLPRSKAKIPCSASCDQSYPSRGRES